jgi:ABC-type transporter Mla MlaB component
VPQSAVVRLAAITRADVPAACADLRAVLDAIGADVVDCDVSALAADLVAIEALARLGLTARRHGCRLRLRSASRRLEELVALCGLDEVLPCEPLAGRRRGEPEEREQPLGVEERVDRDDPPP